MGLLRVKSILTVSLALCAVAARAQTAAPDSDHDGMSDRLEQSLLAQFTPQFFVGQQDCAGLPADFRPGLRVPTVDAEDGTIYGQVFPEEGRDFPETLSGDVNPIAEIHFYHLWDRDCGAHGHALDTEHVAVLVEASSHDLTTATWKALYWYAAAHEDTVCDVSQIARASTLHAEDHGARVWISPGKHASYFEETLCHGGCGADRCEAMVPLRVRRIVNLGEAAHPMNGSVFVASKAWPLAYKMTHTNFPTETVERLNALPEDDIALYNPGKHPAQGVIAVSYTTGEAIAGGGEDTDQALSLAHDKTGNALDKSYRKTKHALGRSMRDVGKALGATGKDKSD
jgi:hypothetical protein